MACSTAIAISPAAADHLYYATQPGATGTAGVNLAQQPVVHIRLAFTNIVPKAVEKVNLAAYTTEDCSTGA